MLLANNYDISFYIEWLRDKGIAETTIRLYEFALNRFLMRSPDITKLEDYNSYLIEYTVKKRNYGFYAALRQYIRFKITDETKKRELLDGMIKPHHKLDYIHERKYLSEEQIFDVINHLSFEKHRVMALIMCLTGIRIGDILRLKQGKISNELYEDKPVLRLNILGKRQKRNVIFIHDEIAQEVVSDYITKNIGWNGYYFIEAHDQHIIQAKLIGRKSDRYNFIDERTLTVTNYDWFRSDLRESLATTGINPGDFAAHDYRRCFARRVWERYKDVHVLQSLLNHQQPGTSLRYLDSSGLKNIDYHKEMQMGKNQ